jgi:hypothetical protein
MKQRGETPSIIILKKPKALSKCVDDYRLVLTLFYYINDRSMESALELGKLN